MSNTVEQSPYPVGTVVKDVGLLQLRQHEIVHALNVVAPEEGSEAGHVVVLGQSHSGRTSVLEEVERRAKAERGWLVVELKAGDRLVRGEFVRHLLTALVESLAATSNDNPEWYAAWRDRVYLRNSGPTGPRDVLTSALVLSADANAWIDPVILDRDLTEIRRIAEGTGFPGIVVSIDDVSGLTEDVPLIEEILAIFDAVGGFSLLMAGAHSIGRHFRQAASRCLERFQPVVLRPFAGPHQIFTALSSPLEGEDTRYADPGDTEFLRDVLRLTGGNPHEVMVVGNYLWLSCRLGEQEKYALTPRVLDRVIPHLAMLASDGDALRDGAQAIDRLDDEQVGRALELAGWENLSLREIAIARVLRVTEESSTDGLAEIQDKDVDEELKRVHSEIEELEEAGVLVLHDDGERFGVIGGRHAAILLKYKARARIGEGKSPWIFGMTYLDAVGNWLAFDMAQRVKAKIPGAKSLGFSTQRSEGGLGRVSPRQVVRSLEASDDIRRLIEAEIDLVPWNREGFERIGELLAADDPTIALVCTSLSYERGQLEYLEVWKLPTEAAHDDVAKQVGDVAEQWEKWVSRGGLSWRGSQSAVLRGAAAREVLCALQSLAASQSVFELFGKWREDGNSTNLEAALRIAVEAVGVMRMTGKSDRELSGELSGMLSRVGFLKSFGDDRLVDAQEALEEAIRIGQGEGWVTKWNLANVLARRGEAEQAQKLLAEVRADKEDWNSRATILVYIPGRSPEESLVEVSTAGIDSLLDLQEKFYEDTLTVDRAAAAERCGESGDPGAEQVAEWVLVDAAHSAT